MRAAVIKWTIWTVACPGAARTMKSTNCYVKKEFHEKMRNLKGEFSLDPILLIITTFPKFMYEMHEDMYYIA